MTNPDDSNGEIPSDMLLNWQFIGGCYDALRVDPLSPGDGAKFPRAFSFGQYEKTPDGHASQPTAVNYLPDSSGRFDQYTAEISSAYDYHSFLKADGSVSVSDPTGSLYSCSLSLSYSRTCDTKQTSHSVFTYTSEKVSLYRLQLRSEDKPDPLVVFALSSDLVAAVDTMKAADDCQTFVKNFGTHYASEVQYGGRATQRIEVVRTEYENFLEQGIDVTAEARATFEVAKGSATGHVGVTRSDKFTGSREVRTEQIVYAGGTAQSNFDQWALYVKDNPAPIALKLVPLYQLLTQAWFPNDPAIDEKGKLLRDTIESYLRPSNIPDPNAGRLKGGDVLSVILVGGRAECYLSTADAKRAETTHNRDSGWWTLVIIDPKNCTEVRNGALVAIKTATGARFLDADLGTDETYDRGSGLAAATATAPTAGSSQWTVELVSTTRTEPAPLVDGDYVRFRNGDTYLLGEVDPQDPPRVFSFGTQHQKGTIWRVSRQVP